MKVSGCKTPDQLRDTLVKLYTMRIESKEARLTCKLAAATSTQVEQAKVQTLKFLVRELKEMEFV
jgi:hypothetical protein